MQHPLSLRDAVLVAMGEELAPGSALVVPPPVLALLPPGELELGPPETVLEALVVFGPAALIIAPRRFPMTALGPLVLCAATDRTPLDSRLYTCPPRAAAGPPGESVELPTAMSPFDSFEMTGVTAGELEVIVSGVADNPEARLRALPSPAAIVLVMVPETTSIPCPDGRTE